MIFRSFGLKYITPVTSNRLKVPLRPIKMSAKSCSPCNGMDDKGPGLLAIFESNPKRMQRINFLGKLFSTNGFELRLAGGAVRDILRGTTPTDIDFATDARPEETLSLLKRHENILRIITTDAGARHGTVAAKFKESTIELKKIKLDIDSSDQTTIPEYGEPKPFERPKYDEEQPFEITTLRCDRDTDGRHAEVEFIKDWKQDAERRDLTINAMFLTIDEGKLIDYYNGQEDLKNNVVKFVGDADKRMKEDYLRILRFFRFWSRFGNSVPPDEATLSTIRANLDGLDKISGERLWVEIKKILGHYPCHEAVKLMINLNLFKRLGFHDSELDDISNSVDTIIEDLIEAQKNVKNYLDNVLADQIKKDPESLSLKKRKELAPVLALASIVRSEEMLKNCHTRMKFSNIEKDTISSIISARGVELTSRTLKEQLVMAQKSERIHLANRLCGMLIFFNKLDLLAEIESWDIPTFPLDGKIATQIIIAHKLPRNKVKDFLDMLKREWFESDFKLSSADLEEILKQRIRELVSQT